MAHTLKTKAHKNFATNVERAKAAGVTTETSQAVYFSLLGGSSSCNFQNGQIASLTDDYLGYTTEYLYDKAVEAGQQNNIKWVGF